MEANELRIGNWINHISFGQVQVHGVNKECIQTEYKNNIYYDDIIDHNSIPLTEELLIKSGSKKHETSQDVILYDFDRFRLIYKKQYNYWYVIDKESACYFTKIEFLHEWQNFVFINNGYELKINLK